MLDREAAAAPPRVRKEAAVRNVSLTVNDVPHELELEPRDLLVYVLREQLGLTGPVVGTIVGAPIARKEDKKLLQGQAQWVDNMRLPGMVFLGVVRSPYAHARIKRVQIEPALAHAGVVAAWSGADLEDEWQGALPC